MQFVGWEGKAWGTCLCWQASCHPRSRAGTSGVAWRRLTVQSGRTGEGTAVPHAFGVVSQCQGSSGRLVRGEAGNCLMVVAGCWHL